MVPWLPATALARPVVSRVIADGGVAVDIAVVVSDDAHVFFSRGWLVLKIMSSVGMKKRTEV